MISGLGGNSALLIATIASSAILVAGVVDDLRTRKFHNWLFITCTVIAIAVSFALGSWGGLMLSVMGFIAGIVVLLPLVLLGIVGAGDMKLVAAFGACAGWEAVLYVVFFSFIWGVLFGVLKVILSGQFKTFVSNVLSIVTLKDRKELVLQKIPFTVAIFMGWLTHLAYRGIL
ncbi:MAG: prepilin peptidase [Bdellovibrionota bacterium]